MYNSIKIYPDVMRSFNTASFTGSYLPIGSNFNFPIRILKICNPSNTDVTVSWDGINAHDFVPAGSYMVYDFGCQRGNGAPAMEAAEGTQIYLNGAAGIGLVYLITLGAVTPAMTSYP
jgi:hypothetical protein